MTTKRSSSKRSAPVSKTEDARDYQSVLFITGSQLPPGVVDLHLGPEEVLKRSLDQVKKDWNAVSHQVMEMVANTSADIDKAGYELNEVSVALGFNAKGQLAFIAEAGIEASVTIVIKRKEKK